jgi:hypothetical protein
VTALGDFVHSKKDFQRQNGQAAGTRISCAREVGRASNIALKLSTRAIGLRISEENPEETIE